MTTKMMSVVLCLALAGAGVQAGDVADDDATAIKAAVADYLGGWFSSDPDRMRKALHPNLSKYTIKKVPGTEVEHLDGIDAESLIAFAAHNQAWVKDKRNHSIEIVYQDPRLALVHAVSDDFYDLCGLVKMNGEWKILHVLWGLNPQEKPAGEAKGS